MSTEQNQFDVVNTEDQSPVIDLQTRVKAHLAQIKKEAEQLGYKYENGLMDWIMWGAWNNNVDQV